MPTRSKDSPDRPLSSATSSAPGSSSARPRRCARARASASSAHTSTYQSFVDAVLATDRAAEFEAARVVGRRMPRRAVLEIALHPETEAAATREPPSVGGAAVRADGRP